MDFSFSPEQEQLRAQAGSCLEKRGDRASWPELARLGWTGASIPEAQGGAGLSFIEEAIVFEELGRALYPGPFFSTVALALPALACAPDLLAKVASGAFTATLAPGTAVEARRAGDRWLLRGETGLVPDAGTVDAFVVQARGPDGIGLYLAEPHDAQAQIRVLDTVDASRGLGPATSPSDRPRPLPPPPPRAKVIAR